MKEKKISKREKPITISLEKRRHHAHKTKIGMNKKETNTEQERALALKYHKRIISIERLIYKIKKNTLTGVPRWLEHQSSHRRATGSIPSQRHVLRLLPHLTPTPATKSCISLTSLFPSFSSSPFSTPSHSFRKETGKKYLHVKINNKENHQ